MAQQPPQPPARASTPRAPPPSQPGPGTAPPPHFVSACERAGVAKQDHAALWGLLLRWRRTGLDDEARLEALLRDHGHWRLYLAARRGDEAAADAFKRHWERYVRALAGRSLGREESDDMLGAFFERVWRLIGVEFHWRCPFEVYLKTLALNLARQQLGSRGRRRRHENALDDCSDAQVQLAASGPDPEQGVLVAERRVRIRALLARIEPGDRHILRMCLVEGDSGQDLARQLGISRDALYQRLRRAKIKLRKLFEEEQLWSD